MSIDHQYIYPQLDGKECFLLWYELGSTEKVTRNLAGKGRINLYTDKPFTAYAVWASAIKWVVNNSAEAREIYIKAGAEVALDEDAWNRKIVRHAMTIYTTRARFFEWLIHQSFDDKYESMYAKRYGILD
jgi:hypothetical protein